MAGLVERLLRGGAVSAGCEVDFHILAHVDADYALVAHVLQRVLHGFALRIEDGLLWGDDDFGFHCGAGKARENEADVGHRLSGRRVFFLP